MFIMCIGYVCYVKVVAVLDAMKTYVLQVDLYTHVFLNSTPVRGEIPPSRPYRFTPEERASVV
jgi:hypothetical protein